MKRLALAAALAASIPVTIGAAQAAQDFRSEEAVEQQRAAFAGATVRWELGSRRGAAPPQARLGIGFTDYRRAGNGAFVSGGRTTWPLEAGLASGRPQLFVGGESLSQIERRLGIAGSRTDTLLVIGGVAAAVVAVLVLTSGGDDDGPCPPGVEVCTQ